MIWHTSRRSTVRPASSPSTDTGISSPSFTPRRSAVPCSSFRDSATWSVVFNPIATSFVTLLPPTGRTEVWNGEPSAKSATSIVPAPRSATATPSSFSVSDRTASAEASESTTSSSIFTPAAATHFVRFCTAVAEADTMCVSTSRRSALIPSGSFTPSWPSTVKPRRSTWSTSRLDGIETARATSIARSMSCRVTSRWWAVTATWPVELRLSTCCPPTPTNARSIFQPDSRSARSTASAIDRTVWSMLTTTPFLRPDAGTVPWPMIVSGPSRLTSPISAATLDVPTSIPTRTASRSTFCVVPRAVGGGGQPAASARRSDEVASDERDVVEDPEAEVDERDQIEIEAEAIADEGEQNRHDRVRDEAADEDPIVVDAIELRADRPEHRIESGEDRHRRIPRELEADVDVEDQPGEDAHEEAREGQEHRVSTSLSACVCGRLPDPRERRQTSAHVPTAIGEGVQGAPRNVSSRDLVITATAWTKPPEGLASGSARARRSVAATAQRTPPAKAPPRDATASTMAPASSAPSVSARRRP